MSFRWINILSGGGGGVKGVHRKDRPASPPATKRLSSAHVGVQFRCVDRQDSTHTCFTAQAAGMCRQRKQKSTGVGGSLRHAGKPGVVAPTSERAWRGAGRGWAGAATARPPCLLLPKPSPFRGGGGGRGE
jgi:hypothetical protein